MWAVANLQVTADVRHENEAAAETLSVRPPRKF